jgi:hypothetical protein
MVPTALTPAEVQIGDGPVADNETLAKHDFGQYESLVVSPNALT